MRLPSGLLALSRRLVGPTLGHEGSPTLLSYLLLWTEGNKTARFAYEARVVYVIPGPCAQKTEATPQSGVTVVVWNTPLGSLLEVLGCFVIQVEIVVISLEFGA